MKQQTRWIAFICIIILLSVAGLGGFYFGKIIEAEHYKAEKNF